MDKRFVDEVDGVSEYISYDETSGDVTIQRTADVEAVAEDVAEKHRQTLGKTQFGWHVGAIPVAVLQQYAHSRGISNFWDLCSPEYAGELMRLCTDADYRKFSPTGGKH